MIYPIWTLENAVTLTFLWDLCALDGGKCPGILPLD